MSTTKLRSRIEEEHLTCTICFNVFKNPKALPCLHTFCEHCLREFVTSRGFESSGEFPCPVCRQIVNIPPGGVQCFPDNHLVKSLSDTVVDQSYSQSNGESEKPIAQFADRNSNSLHSVEDSQYHPSKCLLKFGQRGAGINDFNLPVGLDVTCNGDFVVSDTGNGRIFVFDCQGELKTTINCECRIKDVAVSRRNEILVVVNKPSVALQIYTVTGHLLGEHGKFITHEDPHGIAALANGGAVITSKQNQNVFIFTDQFKYSSKFGRKGTGDGYFHSPVFAATNSKNQIIVSDDKNDTVQVFNWLGELKFRFGRSGSKPGEFIRPMGVATDNDDNVFVADSGNWRVQKFNCKGVYQDMLVTDTHCLGADVRPVNVALTLTGDVAVLLVGPALAEVRTYKAGSSREASVRQSSVCVLS